MKVYAIKENGKIHCSESEAIVAAWKSAGHYVHEMYSESVIRFCLQHTAINADDFIITLDEISNMS